MARQIVVEHVDDIDTLLPHHGLFDAPSRANESDAKKQRRERGTSDFRPRVIGPDRRRETRNHRWSAQPLQPLRPGAQSPPHEPGCDDREQDRDRQRPRPLNETQERRHGSGAFQATSANSPNRARTANPWTPI